MEKETDEQRSGRQHDIRVFHESEAIFSEGDLRELINYTYSEYQYKGTQIDRLVKLANFLDLESNRFIKPELAIQSKRLNDFLNTLLDFLQRNFRQGEQNEIGETIYFFQTGDNSSENEAFLAEFQMVAVDIERAYSNYRAAAIRELKI
jgi:hypothetical protein